jgi:hypothetical protein
MIKWGYILIVGAHSTYGPKILVRLRGLLWAPTAASVIKRVPIPNPKKLSMPSPFLTLHLHTSPSCALFPSVSTSILRRMSSFRHHCRFSPTHVPTICHGWKRDSQISQESLSPELHCASMAACYRGGHPVTQYQRDRCWRSLSQIE